MKKNASRRQLKQRLFERLLHRVPQRWKGTWNERVYVFSVPPGGQDCCIAEWTLAIFSPRHSQLRLSAVWSYLRNWSGPVCPHQKHPHCFTCSMCQMCLLLVQRLRCTSMLQCILAESFIVLIVIKSWVQRMLWESTRSDTIFAFTFVSRVVRNLVLACPVRSIFTAGMERAFAARIEMCAFETSIQRCRYQKKCAPAADLMHSN